MDCDRRFLNILLGVCRYVVQDDVVMGTLTVKENLQFAANLRMRKATSAEKSVCVQQLIVDLGLEKCANTKVGTELIKGVSGGERKRCNIGIELVTKPPVLFLGIQKFNSLHNSLA